MKNLIKNLFLGLLCFMSIAYTVAAQPQTQAQTTPPMLPMTMQQGLNNSPLSFPNKLQGNQQQTQVSTNINNTQGISYLGAIQPKQSSIEKLFNEDMKKPLTKDSDLVEEPLNQIGYDIFTNASAQGFGKYDSTYVLSIGEKVDVYFWGDSIDMLSISGSPLLTPLTKTQVDGKGNLFVPGVGMVKAEGKTIGQIEKDIQALASGKYTNIKVRITVADTTDFTVFVYGYVNKPGKVAVNNNSSVLEALAAAGGVSKSGSLRNVTYKSSGKSRSVDLYKIIFEGQESNVRLKPNDTIFVNKIGSVVAVKNGIEVPGIYEITSSDSIENLINYAGGLLPSTNKKTVNIKAYNSNEGQRISMDIPVGLFQKTKLSNGDILEFSSLYGKAEDYVTLEGNVKHPAVFAYKKGMKLSDILKNKNELCEETLIYQAVIKRMANDGKEIVTLPISLKDFFNGGNDPQLRPRDVITVYKNTNSDFIEVYGCIDKPKRMPYSDKLTLKDIMADVQFITPANNDSNIHNISSISSDNVLIPADEIAVEITNDSNADETGIKRFNVNTIYLYDVLVQNDAVDDITINRGDKILFRPLRKDEIVKTVKISGYVSKPGVYGFVDGKKLSEMLEAAGGLTNDANLKGIVFKRVVVAQRQKEAILEKNEKDLKQIEGQLVSDTNSSKDDTESRQQAVNNLRLENNNLGNNATTYNNNSNSSTNNTQSDQISSDKRLGRITLDIKTNDITKIRDAQNLIIQDGDEIYIPKYSNHVMVIGEVYNETSFVYKENANAAYYVKLVGGFTPNARRTKLYKISVNGRAQRLNLLANNKIEPGDTIIVPRKIRGNDWVQPLASSLQSIASLLTAIYVVTKL